MATTKQTKRGKRVMELAPTARLEIKQVGSTIGREKSQLATLRSLGLGRIGRSVEHTATPSIVGKLIKIGHLVEVRELA